MAERKSDPKPVGDGGRAPASAEKPAAGKAAAAAGRAERLAAALRENLKRRKAQARARAAGAASAGDGED